MRTIIFILSIFSGSFLLRKKYSWRLEDGLPVTVGLIVLIEYIFGLFGGLFFGWVICASLSLIIIGYVLISSLLNLGFWKNKFNGIKDSINKISDIYEPIIIFLLVVSLVFFSTRYMRLHNWDEFSHWGVVVKQMCLENKLGTRTSMHLIASNYPPGMSLFQYYYEGFYTITSKKFSFKDSGLYFSYIVMIMCYIVPLASKASRKYSCFMKAVVTVLFLIFPVIFFNDYFHSIYIDCFLGVMCGVGLAYISIDDTTLSIKSLLYISSVCFVVSISKSSGILFASVLFITYFVVVIKKHHFRDIWKNVLILSFFSYLPYAAWNIETRLSNKGTINTTPIHLSSVIQVLTGKVDDNVKSIISNMGKAIFGVSEPSYVYLIGDTNITVSYWILILIILLSLVCLSLLSKYYLKKNYKNMIICSIMSVSQWIIFYLGMMFTYIFEFGGELSGRLASYVRYVHTVYLGISILLITFFVYMIGEISTVRYKIIGNFLITGMLLVVPWKYIYRSFSGLEVRDSINYAAQYDDVINQINKLSQYWNENIRVYVICQDKREWFSGAASLATYYGVLPNMANYEEDAFVLSNEVTGWFCADYTSAEWMDILVNRYDYVAIYQVDDYFIDTYQELFTDRDTITGHSIYYINKDKRILEKIGE